MYVPRIWWTGWPWQKMSSKVKVIGQRSRSLDWKTWFSDFQMSGPVQVHFWHDMWHHMTSHDVALWRQDVTWRHSMTLWPHLESLGMHTDQEGTTREGRQRSGVFILCVERQACVSQIGNWTYMDSRCSSYICTYHMWMSPLMSICWNHTVHKYHQKHYYTPPLHKTHTSQKRRNTLFQGHKLKEGNEW